MARTRTMIVNLFAFVAMVVCFSCSNDNQDLLDQGDKTVKVIYPYGEPEDSVTVTLRDSVGRILVTGFNLGKYAEVVVEDTRYADAKEAWKPAERLVKNVAETAETAFRYNHGVNTVGSKVVLVVKQDYYKDLGDGKVIRLKKGDIIPLWKPENLNLKGGEPVTEVVEGTSFYAETRVNYQLRYSEVVLAEGIQPFIAEEGYVPSFKKMIWKSWHFGPATASYADGKATVTCPDSLVAHEVWDDGSNRNWLRKTTTSKNIFSVAVSGTEVDDINAVVGKSLTVNGDKASVAEFSVTVTRTSKEIVEKNVPYTYNGKSINFVDSLHACGYKLNGGQVISKSQVRVDMVREGSSETVSFNLPVNITEKVTLKEILRNYIHKAFRKVASVSGNIITIICDNNGEMTKVFSNNTKEKSDIPYTWTFKFAYSIPSGLTTDVIGHTYNFNNGSTSVEGKSLTVAFSSSSISDIMFEGKNYKSEAPQCSVEVKAITFNSKTQATVTFNGEGETVTALVPVNLTEKHDPDFDGRIIWGGATDSYVDGANVATWEGTYMHFIVENNGAYKVYSRKVGDNSWTSTDVSAAYATSISNSKAAAFIGNTASGYSLGSCQWQDQGNWTKIVYFDYNGNVARVISEISKTIGGESSNNCRMPLRGTWANGKITVDGTTYVVTGSK